MRVSSEKPCKNGGWLHPINPDQKPVMFRPQPRKEEPHVNCTALMREWSTFTDHASIKVLADKLSVSPLALRCLGVVWSGDHWAFPMKDEWGNIVGIQFRYQNDFKQTMRGSHVGYFIPDCPSNRTAFVCEGASDTASALTLGLYAVGRYNCSQSGIKLGQYLRRHGVREAVICTDNDGPGIAGAEKLMTEIGILCCVYTPPAKDLRQAVGMGITKALICDTIGCLSWTTPTRA